MSCPVSGRMPAHFAPERSQSQVFKGALAGVAVAATAVVLRGARQVPATTSAEMVRLAPDGAGATNVISAIIVHFRALDTVGEITMLFVAAVGVASRVLTGPQPRRRRRGRPGVARTEPDQAAPAQTEQEVALEKEVVGGQSDAAEAQVRSG